MGVQSLTLPFPTVSFLSPTLSLAASSSSSPSPSPSSLIFRGFCGPYPRCSFVLGASFDLRSAIGISRRGRSASHVVCMAPEEEKMTRRSPLDFPIEWERPKPGRRPDIFPQFSPMKTPLPPPLPADPPDEDEEEEEKKEEEEEDPEKEETDKPVKQYLKALLSTVHFYLVYEKYFQSYTEFKNCKI